MDVKQLPAISKLSLQTARTTSNERQGPLTRSTSSSPVYHRDIIICCARAFLQYVREDLEDPGLVLDTIRGHFDTMQTSPGASAIYGFRDPFVLVGADGYFGYPDPAGSLDSDSSAHDAGGLDTQHLPLCYSDGE
uniref:Uncharacterized protein n=1 Tax=Timema tahoe TaxID=61484 RepID=A0A7R9II47_9NEOP|nr:unnamed protein product [Timema tahoe]